MCSEGGKRPLLPLDVEGGGGLNASKDIRNRVGFEDRAWPDEGKRWDGTRTLAIAHANAAAAATGACAGELLTTLMFYPIELVKNRLQSTLQGGGVGSAYAYRGLMHGLLRVVMDEGVAGLFTGLNSVVVRSMTSEAATVYIGEFLLGCYRLTSRGGHDLMAVPLRTLGGWASVLLTLPFETVATRVTTTRPPLGAWAAAKVLVDEGGLPALWSGLPASLVLCLNPALMLSAVDWLRRLLFAFQRLRGQCPQKGQAMSVAQAFVVGAVAKLLTMSIVYPLVRGKVLLQARNEAGAGIFQVLRWVVQQEGVQSLYRGLGAQMSKSILSASVKYAVKEKVEKQSQQMFLKGTA